MTTEKLRFSVPGRTYYAALDPQATGAEEPLELGGDALPSPERKKVGFGSTFWYELTRCEALRMLGRLEDIGAAFADNDDPVTRAESRSCLTSAERLEKILETVTREES